MSSYIFLYLSHMYPWPWLSVVLPEWNFNPWMALTLYATERAEVMTLSVRLDSSVPCFSNICSWPARCRLPVQVSTQRSSVQFSTWGSVQSDFSRHQETYLRIQDCLVSMLLSEGHIDCETIPEVDNIAKLSRTAQQWIGKQGLVLAIYIISKFWQEHIGLILFSRT